MKKIVLGSALLLTSIVTFAQKIGHVNSAVIIENHPSKASADSQLQALSTTFESAVKAKADAYQAKMKEYQEKFKSTQPTEAQLSQADAELKKIETDATQLEKDAQIKFEAKRKELYDPIFDSIQNAIDKVAAAQGLNYVIDSSARTLVYEKGGNDITPAVKKELGITK